MEGSKVKNDTLEGPVSSIKGSNDLDQDQQKG
jgi:hypothetical protein